MLPRKIYGKRKLGIFNYKTKKHIKWLYRLHNQRQSFTLRVKVLKITHKIIMGLFRVIAINPICTFQQALNRLCGAGDGVRREAREREEGSLQSKILKYICNLFCYNEALNIFYSDEI